MMQSLKQLACQSQNQLSFPLFESIKTCTLCIRNLLVLPKFQQSVAKNQATLYRIQTAVVFRWPTTMNSYSSREITPRLQLPAVPPYILSTFRPTRFTILKISGGV